MLGAEFPGHEDAETLGHALDHAENHPVEPIRGTQRCQRIDAQRLAHHHGVHNGVELLEHIAHHQRQGEGNEQRQGSAHGHIFYFRTHM